MGPGPARHRLQRRGGRRCHDPAPSVAADQNEWRLRRRRGVAHHQPEPVGSEGRKEDGHDPCHRTPPIRNPRSRPPGSGRARRATADAPRPARATASRAGRRSATASLSMSEIGRLSLATPTTQRNAETSRAFGGELERPPRCGHRKARDLRNDRAQPDMTQTFLKAIEDRLLVAAFEIDDRSDFRSAWARAGAKRSGRSRHRRTFPRVRAATGDERAAAAPSIAPWPPPATSCSAPSARPPTGSRASISASPNGNAVVTRRRRSSIWRTWAHRTSMSEGGRADLMELLGWRFEHVRSSSGFQSRPGTSALSGYVSRALTPEASLDLGSNFIELREAPPGVGCLTTSGRLADRGGVSFAAFGRHCGHKIRITGGNSPVLACTIVGW